MRHGVLVAIAAILLLLLVMSCGDKSTCPPCECDLNGIEDFPSGVGSQWLYSRYDHISGRSDTIIVRVVGTAVRDDGGLSFVWRYMNRSWVDTHYVTFRCDTAIVYRDRSGFWVESMYVFPLTVGDGWVNVLVTVRLVKVSAEIARQLSGSGVVSFLVRHVFLGNSKFGGNTETPLGDQDSVSFPAASISCSTETIGPYFAFSASRPFLCFS